MEPQNLIPTNEIWEVLFSITDPEIPILSIIDLGIVKSVHLSQFNEVEVNITPTYTACPAMNVIAMQIKLNLLPLGFNKVTVNVVLHPIWSTDDITEIGKNKLKEYGIAPPKGNSFLVEDGVECPRCNTMNTKLISEFGSTACKALYKCEDCLEPFDYFKCY